MNDECMTRVWPRLLNPSNTHEVRHERLLIGWLKSWCEFDASLVDAARRQWVYSSNSSNDEFGNDFYEDNGASTPIPGYDNFRFNERHPPPPFRSTLCGVTRCRSRAPSKRPLGLRIHSSSGAIPPTTRQSTIIPLAFYDLKNFCISYSMLDLWTRHTCKAQFLNQFLNRRIQFRVNLFLTSREARYLNQFLNRHISFTVNLLLTSMKLNFSNNSWNDIFISESICFWPHVKLNFSNNSWNNVNIVHP
jgi:hypothetical protein